VDRDLSADRICSSCFRNGDVLHGSLS
jgi:hypothetical protein